MKKIKYQNTRAAYLAHLNKIIAIALENEK